MLRVLLALFLLIPLPVLADHVPTQAPYGVDASDDANAGTFTIGILGSDGFEDSPPESYTIFFSQSSGVTETNSFCVTTSFGHSANTWQYHTFSLDNLKYYFNDPAGTNIYYRVRSNNITDYSFSTLTNENSWNLYAGPPFDYNQTDWSAPTGTDACDDPKILDGTPAPTTPTVQVNYKEGTVTVSWDIASGTYQYPPERYAIGFGLADNGSMPYGVATGNVGDANALNEEYTFTADYLNTVFNETHGLFNVKVRSDNDTNSSYSAWSSTVQTTIQNKPAWVDDFSYTLSNTGALISWTKDDTGFVPVDNFKIWVREGDGDWSVVTTLNNTTTSFAVGHTSVTEDTQFQWNLQACGSEGDCNTAGPLTYTWEYVTPTLGPPMNPVVSQTYNVGVVVDWDEPNTGNQTADSYELYYRTSAENETVITGITETQYTIPYANIPNGTYTFSIRAYDSINNVYSGYSTEPTLEVFNQKAKDDADAAASPPPPPPPPEPEKVEVVMEDGSKSEYKPSEVEDGTVDRDNQRKTNEDKFGCYMTDAQIERGDCNISKEEPKEEVIIVVDEERDTKEELPDDDVVVPELEPKDEVKEPEPIKEEDTPKEEIKIDVKELEEEFKFEEEDFVLEVIIIEEDIDEEVEEITEEVLDEPIQKDVEEVLEDELYEEIPGDDSIREKEIQEEDVKDQVVQEVKELTEEEIAVEVAEIEEVVEVPIVEEDATEEEVAEAIEEYVEELETEEVIEVLEEVNDVGVQNLEEVSEEVQEVIQAVVEEAIEDVEELTEEQVAVVAEVLQVQEDDVEIIAEAVKEDEAVAEAVEEYVERAVENADVENYTLADVVTEVQYENFLENPIETFVDLDFEGITISNIGDDMTQDQKEKAQEVVVPVILTRIATMAAFVFRRSL